MMTIFKNKKFINTISCIAVVVITLILSLLIHGHSPADLTLDPSGKITKLAGEKQAIQVFSSDDFQLYYINTDEGATHYAFSKMLGFWHCNYYPHRNDIIGITHGKNYIYYYGRFASNENYDYIESEQGEKIYPNKFEYNGKTLNVYQIPKTNDEKVIYRFMDKGNSINNETLLLNGGIVFHKYEDGKNIDIESTVVKLQQDDPHLWEQIEKVIESADKSKKIENGRVYGAKQEDYLEYSIFVSYKTGDYLSLEKGHKGYDWTGVVSYDIEIEGQHPNTISVFTRDYSEASLYEKTFGKSHVHPITVSDELKNYFEELEKLNLYHIFHRKMKCRLYTL